MTTHIPQCEDLIVKNNRYYLVLETGRKFDPGHGGWLEWRFRAFDLATRKHVETAIMIDLKTAEWKDASLVE